ncbi:MULTISPECIES: YfcZ/YiiS family protein [Vibrio]|uniref:DUF406 family protein n=1 Tax=Vibrio algicola TaxID=2662262 RepID=A0A5Q0THU9_9VIBR|nr:MULTISPECIES: YfcZ/YiiS family protein [Vibrio]MBD1576629.1 DUF406 family protein [Vibrio sp. S11_S32]
MSNERQELELVSGENEVCEACGCSAEMGFIIKEGDDVADVHIQGPNKETLLAHFAPYLALAKEVNADFQHEIEAMADDATTLTARIKFECSAEKLIFELKSRSLNR